MRTIVSGMGMMCAIGHNQDEVLNNIINEKSGIDTISLFDHSYYECKIGGEVKNYIPSDFFTKEELLYLNRCSQFAILSIKQALAQAKLDLKKINSYDIGICIGTSHGGADELFDIHKILLNKKEGVVSKEKIFRAAYYGLAKTISSYFGINGISFLSSIACASGANSIGLATDLIKSKKAKYIICGGTDGFDLSTFAGFCGLNATSNNPTSPFSVDNIGITLGEGAAFFVVEDISTANERGVSILSEIYGYGISNDAHHASAPHPMGYGATRCMISGLKNGGVEKSEIGYINTHGTGTNANDEAEKNAILALYDNNTEDIPPLSSTKPYTGHATGAAGALEFAISILCMNKGILPPTLNFISPRFKEELDYIPNKVRTKDYNYFLSNSFGFAGCNIALIGGKFNESKNPNLGKKEQRVVITGIGCVSSVGIGKEEIFEALKQGKQYFQKIDLFDVSKSRSTIAAQINTFNPRKYDRRIDDRRMDRISQFATVAAHLCLEDSNYKVVSKKNDDIGIVYAVAPGTIQGKDKHFESMINFGLDRPSQIYFPYSTQNASLGQITVNKGIGGYATNIVEGNASLGALILAYDAIKKGYQQRLLAGGSDELYWNYHHFWDVMGELKQDSTLDSPLFSNNQNGGYTPGEGSAFLMVEGIESAKERGATIYGEIVGYGISIDSNKDMPTNDATGENLLHAMKMALDEAGINAHEITMVFSSERGIDCIAQSELIALDKFFGKHQENVVYSNTRFNTGWLNSSTSIFNLISLFYTFINGHALPIAGSPEISSNIKLKICDKLTDVVIKYAMILHVSREGTNTALIIKHTND